MKSDRTDRDGMTPLKHLAKPGDWLMAKLPLTFRGQAMLFLVPVIFLISLVYTIESISTERKILRNEIIKNGETITTITAKNAELAVLSENMEHLKSAALSVMEIKDVAFVSFANNRQEILLHEGKPHPERSSPEAVSARGITFVEYEDIFEFRVPVVTVRAQEGLFLFEGADAPPPVREQVGWVHIGLSKEIMAQSEREIVARGSILAGIFSLLGIFLAYILISLATRPLYALISAVKEVREGEHPEVPVLSPKTEIGKLCTEFNRMSRAISQREAEVLDKVKELELTRAELQDNVQELELTRGELQENVQELELTQAELEGNVQELELEVEAREAAEKELITHRNNLEDLVGERTAELTVAKELAETANRAKSDFLSSMSHELRTPLNAILGYAQILRRQENLTDAQRQQMEVMRTSGEHLLTLINDILDVGKIEAEKMELEEIPFDLQALMRQVYSITRLSAEEKELSFEHQAESPLPAYVRGDERKLRQILLNLLSNAVKNTRRGSIVLRLSYGVAGAGVLRCEVADTGIGIPADKQEAIFEPFVQLVSERQVRQGTGLGLNITKRLLALMGGSIGVQSEPGRGSTFRIEVPLQTITESESALEQAESDVVGYRGERKRIMVVDDTVGNTALLVSLLEPLGFKVDTAADGIEALERAMERRPDLVLMDLVMPQMDGLEAVRELRRRPGLEEIKIIGASATVTASMNKDAFVALCDDFVTKPIRIDLLLEKIGRALGIEWETAQSSVPESARKCESRGDDLLVPPSPAQLEELYDLAMRGDMQRITAWAAELASLEERHACFAQKLQELSKAFKAKAILALVEQYRGEAR